MENRKYGISGAVLACIGLHLLIFVFAVPSYPGHPGLYLIYTLLSSGLIYIGVVYGTTYTTPVLAVFLWLGGWLKLSLHLIFDYGYVEPIGAFAFTRSQYDEFMIAACVASAAICLAWGGARAFIQTAEPLPERRRFVSSWAWWAIFLIIVTGVVATGAANLYFGIYQIGVVAKTTFHWPVNAVFGWVVSMGWSMLIAFMLYFSTASPRRFYLLLGVAILEALISSATSISRGLYVVHLLPIVYAIYINRKSLTLKRLPLIWLVAVAAFGFVLCGLYVNSYRNVVYFQETTELPAGAVVLSQQHMHATKQLMEAKGMGTFLYDSLAGLLKLAVDRWIGVEGLMVATGHPEKSPELLFQLTIEKPAIGYITKYQYIANADYTKTNPDKYQFITIPGPAGAFYLSGSLLILFVGMLALVAVALFYEKMVSAVMHNPFLNALLGVWLANGVAQYGVAPRQLLIQLLLHTCGILGLLVLARLLRRQTEKTRALG